jgi:hypothetical protein
MARKQQGVLKAITESGLGLVKAVTSVLAEATDSLTSAKDAKALKAPRHTSSHRHALKIVSKRKGVAAKERNDKGRERKKRTATARTKS